MIGDYPSFLGFDPTTRTFSGTSEVKHGNIIYTIQLQVKDEHGGVFIGSFQF